MTKQKWQNRAKRVGKVAERAVTDLLLHVLHALVLSVDLLRVLLKAVLVDVERAEGEPAAVEGNLLRQTLLRRVL